MRLLVDEVPRVPASIVHSLGVATGASDVEVTVRVAGISITAIVGLSWTRQRNGGTRPWFRCSCGARRRWIYVVAHGFRCRDCPDLRLTYRCRRDHRTAHYEQVVRPMLEQARAWVW